MAKKRNKDFHSRLQTMHPWDHNKQSIWLASSLKIFRNIEQFPFPGKQSVEQEKQVVTLVGQELVALSELSYPTLIRAEELKPLEKEFLYEHYLSAQSFHQAREGEAFVMDDEGLFLAILNLKNHIQLHLTDIEGKLEESWNRLVSIETALGKNVNYAFNSQFGFLTADPTHCGTGLSVSIYLQVPALIHTGNLAEAISKGCSEGIYVTGIQGDPQDFIGDVVVLRNSFSLGLTEENIIASLQTALTKLIVEEKSCRSQVASSGDPAIKDSVARAFGLLRHSYQMETVEALGAISLIKLGSEIGWITGMTTEKLNELFFHCRRAHLVQAGDGVDQAQVTHERAEFIHQAFKKSEMTL